MTEYKFDIIVSNPPYIKRSEKQNMEVGVWNYEPEHALYVPDEDPLKFYDTISVFALQTLKNNGVVFFEINALHGADLILSMRNMGFKNVELKQDINGLDRMLKAEIG